MGILDHILVPLDGSRLAECVLPHAATIARAFEAQITLLHVVTDTERSTTSPSLDPLRWHISKAESQAYLDEIAARLRAIGLQVEVIILEGKAAERIIDFARNKENDLLILSSHGQSGLSGWNISSVVQKILMRAYASIMIVRAYHPSKEDLTSLCYHKLLVPLDCSKRAECALPMALKLANCEDATLMVTHIVQRPEIPCYEMLSQEDNALLEKVVKRSKEISTAYLEELCSYYPEKMHSHLSVSDTPHITLQNLVEQEAIDLVILSAHGYSGSVRWPYGSLVTSFIAYGTSPLLIVQDISPDKIQLTQAEIAAKEQKGH